MAAVEFALIAPLFLLLIFAIFVYGFYFAAWVAVRHAAAEGARAAVAGLSVTERTTLATTMVQSIFSAYSPVLDWKTGVDTITAGAGDCANCFQVQVTYDLSELGTIPMVALPSTTITATSIVPNGGF
jgi:Flp pilus assembly protein TadG